MSCFLKDSYKTPQISGVHLTRTTDSESALHCSKLKERTCKLYNPALVSAQFGNDSCSCNTNTVKHFVISSSQMSMSCFLKDSYKTPQISGVHLTRTTDSESALHCSKLKERTCKLYHPALAFLANTGSCFQHRTITWQVKQKCEMPCSLNSTFPRPRQDQPSKHPMIQNALCAIKRP